MLPSRRQTPINFIKILNILFVLASVSLCTILMMLRIPGMELLNTNPNWLLIWVVAWGTKRTIWQGAIAGFSLGCIYDGISLSAPSHILGFVLVGTLTSALQKQKYIGEDFISIAFIVFFMTILAESVYAVQYASVHFINPEQVFIKYKQIAIISAIITSLWSPAFYYPFSIWHNKMKKIARKETSLID